VWEVLVCQHLTVAYIAEALAVSWDTANDAVLAEGRRVLLRGRTHISGTRLGPAGRTLDVLGLLAARARRYALERAAWAWWTDELASCRPRPRRSSEPRGAGLLELAPTASGRTRDHHGRHPVDHRGRADYAAALAHLSQARGGRRQAS
jgi:hypothetical protein